MAIAQFKTFQEKEVKGMAKGDGSIQELKKKDGTSYAPKRWRVRVDFGVDPVTNKRVMVSRNVKGTKADARKVRDRLRQEHEQGLVAKADKVTFGEFSTEWFERRTASGATTKDTAKREKGMLNVLNGYLSGVALGDITARTIDSLYEKIREDRGICNTTLQGYHQVLNMIMKQAVDYDMILRNPCERVKTPKREPVDRRSLSQQEGARLLRVIDEEEDRAYRADADKEERMRKVGKDKNRSRLYNIGNVARVVAARLGLATGARRGEILGISWRNLDLEAGVATIKDNLNKTDGLKVPKTDAGYRKVSLDPATVESLVRWRDYQKAALMRIGVEVTEESPVFTSGTGDYMNPSGFSRWWRKFSKEAGFEGLKFHELRHTQATVLLANKVDVKTVQTRLGHASASITLNLYAHAVPENDREAADLVGDLFKGGKPRATRKEDLREAV